MFLIQSFLSIVLQILNKVALLEYINFHIKKCGNTTNDMCWDLVGHDPRCLRLTATV